MGQGLLTKRMGKSRVIAETGAGQHGVATATMAARMGFQCTVYMGALDVERQRPNVFWMEQLRATVVVVEDGSQTLKDAINAALRDWSGPWTRRTTSWGPSVVRILSPDGYLFSVHYRSRSTCAGAMSRRQTAHTRLCLRGWWLKRLRYLRRFSRRRRGGTHWRRSRGPGAPYGAARCPSAHTLAAQGGAGLQNLLSAER